MASSMYRYICIKEDGTCEIIASQSIYSILDKYDDYCNPFTSIIRQDLYRSDSDNYCKTTTWHD